MRCPECDKKLYEKYCSGMVWLECPDHGKVTCEKDIGFDDFTEKDFLKKEDFVK